MQSVTLVGMIRDMAETRGQRLKARREAARIPQKDLAERAHVSVRSLQNLEQGHDGERNMRRTADAVETALVAMLAEMPAVEPTSPPQRRLRAVEAIIRDEEDVVGVTTREVRPGVRVASIVLLDSDIPVDDDVRAELLRLRDEALRDSPER